MHNVLIHGQILPKSSNCNIRNVNASQNQIYCMHLITCEFI